MHGMNKYKLGGLLLSIDCECSLENDILYIVIYRVATVLYNRRLSGGSPQ